MSDENEHKSTVIQLVYSSGPLVKNPDLTQGQQKMVKDLQETLERAKKGEVVGMVLATYEPNREEKLWGSFTKNSKPFVAAQLAGALEMISHRMLSCAWDHLEDEDEDE